MVGDGLDHEVVAALLCVGVEERLEAELGERVKAKRTYVSASRVVAALRVGSGTGIRNAAAVLSVETGCSPEHVVVLVKDVFLEQKIRRRPEILKFFYCEK